jgi:hypothetical protein
MKRQIGIFAAILLVALGVRAYGDYAATSGSGLTVFSFTCFTSKVCTTATLVNSAGAEAGVAAVPLQVSLANTAANGTAVKVDNSGVTQPVSGTVTANQGGTWTVQPGNTANTTPWLSTIAQGGNSAVVKAANTVASTDVGLVVAVANTNANLATNADSVAAVAAGAAGAGSPVNSAGYCWNGSTWDRCKANADPCSYAAKTNLPISFQTTSITQQIALSGSTKIYVCSLSLIASAATVFSITGGTGTNCGTPAALIGTTSATHGLSLAANGGMTLGNGAGTVAVTGAGSELCLVQSGSGDLVGNLTYVQQ